jgi:hypothetical protein
LQWTATEFGIRNNQNKFMATATINQPATAPITPVTGGNNFLESILPGINNLTSTATGNIQNLLSGLPSVSAARQSNAYFGAQSGMPGSDFVRNRGYDLYGQQAQQRQQTGLEDLLQTIGTYSSPALGAQGQALQNQQFGQNLAQQGSQFDQSLAQKGSQFSQDFGLQQQNQAFGEQQAALTTSPEYLTMLANLKNYGTTGGAATQPTTGVGPLVRPGAIPASPWAVAGGAPKYSATDILRF